MVLARRRRDTGRSPRQTLDPRIDGAERTRLARSEASRPRANGAGTGQCAWRWPPSPSSSWEYSAFFASSVAESIVVVAGDQRTPSRLIVSTAEHVASRLTLNKPPNGARLTTRPRNARHPPSRGRSVRPTRKSCVALLQGVPVLSGVRIGRASLDPAGGKRDRESARLGCGSAAGTVVYPVLEDGRCRHVDVDPPWRPARLIPGVGRGTSY